MTGLRAALGLALLFLVLIAARAFAAGTTARIEVPIYQRQLPDGTIRYWVSVRVGGSAPIAAMLDTGSFGLRVLQSALSPSDYQDTGIERRLAYGSGVALHGPLATAVIQIGDATSETPITFQLVRSVGCIPRKPDCPAARVSPEDYRIGGNGLPGQGFEAILGLSLRRPRVAMAALNPLDLIGAQQWIVVLPLPGAADPGRLIINPAPQDLDGFRSAQVAPPPIHRPGMVRMIDPNCPAGEEAQTEACEPVKLDSGAGDGLKPYYSFAVFYDARSGAIGVKPRADAGR
ncbi:MAG TPA: hypothetical protein VJ770_02850 [Stellaceae bacterium]|nr:hypothetical protein [Stellaceae bacterium]